MKHLLRFWIWMKENWVPVVACYAGTALGWALADAVIPGHRMGWTMTVLVQAVSGIVAWDVGAWARERIGARKPPGGA